MTVTFDHATLSKLSPRDLKVLIWRQKWLQTARPNQLPPDDDSWLEWILRSGRGFGKTRAGAEWMGYEALMDPEALPSFVIAPTLNDVRYTCFEGPTGILTLLPAEVIADYNKTNLIIILDNGAQIRGFSAEEPERLRGPQCSRGWLEEVGAWGPRDEETFDMFMMGLRLGPRPRFAVTTTPKPRDLIRTLTTPKSRRIIVSGSTYDNKANLPDSFFEQLKKYEGTQLGRQELEGELIDAEEGGIIQRGWIRKWPANKPLPKFEWVVTSYDTAFTERTIDKRTMNADPTACGIFGVFWADDGSTHILLIDCWQDHLSLPELTKRVKKQMEVGYGDDQDTPILKPMIGPARSQGAGRKSDIILIEDKGSGISLRQNLALDGIFTYPYNPGRADKTTRLHLASDVFARGQFWVPESEHPDRKGQFKTWAEPLVTQICSYRGPNSIKHDDFCDVVSQVVIFLKTKNMVNAIKRPKTDRERDRELEENPAPKSKGNPYAQ